MPIAPPGLSPWPTHAWACRLSHLLLLLALAFSFSTLARPDEKATNDILQYVPRTVGACLIVDDLGQHVDRVKHSKTYQNFLRLPTVKKAMQSNAARSLGAMDLLAKAYFGLDSNTLLHDVLGQSVVLVLKPGSTLGKDDIGIVFLRAKTEKNMKTVFNALTRPGLGRRVEKRTYKNVEYIYRKEGRNKDEFFLRLGPVGLLTDKENAVQAVIETSLDAEQSLLQRDDFLYVRQQLPKQCLVQLIVDPRAFDSIPAQAAKNANDAGEIWVADTMGKVWKNTLWAAFTLRVDDQLELGVHAQVTKDLDEAATNAISTSKPNPNAEPGAEVSTYDFWHRLPPSTLSALAVDVNVSHFVKTVLELAAKNNEDRELRTIYQLLDSVILGHKMEKDVLPRLGPHAGFVTMTDSKGDSFSLLTVLELRDRPAPQPGLDSLSKAIDQAIRPLIVLGIFEHNRKQKDQVEMKTQVIEKNRVHSLVHSKRWPAWMVPSFAVTSQNVLVGSHPRAIAQWLESQPTSKKSSTTGPQGNSKNAQGPRPPWRADLLPKGAEPLMYVNISAFRRWAQKHHAPILATLAPKHAAGQREAEQKLNALLAGTGLMDQALLYHRHHKRVHHFVFVLSAPSS